MAEGKNERMVVLAPDLIGAALIDPSARRVLERWRDGEFKVVCNRELLGMHLRVLRQLGLPAELLRRWSFWFTAPEKAVYLAEAIFRKQSAMALCQALTLHVKVEGIISWKGAKRGGWIAASAFELLWS